MTAVLFAVYIAALVWIILFKFQRSLATLPSMRALNLIPFSGGTSRNDIVDNLLVFIPYGIYVGMLRPGWSPARKIAPVFLTSLLFEALQYAFGIGASDINDLLFNTLGGAVGIAAYHLFARALGTRTQRVLNIVALVATILAITLLAAMSLFITYRF